MKDAVFCDDTRNIPEDGILQNHGFLPCQSSDILQVRKHKVSETGSVSILR
jgi:hypothetical protein